MHKPAALKLGNIDLYDRALPHADKKHVNKVKVPKRIE